MQRDVFTQTGSHTWNNPGVGVVNVLVVGGGGGGGGSAGGSASGGGGGAGGVVHNASYSVSGDQNVTVGAGGTGGAADADDKGDNGNDSSFGGLTAIGGGGGGSRDNGAGKDGGSGGGAGSRDNDSPGGTGSQGSDGGSAGSVASGNNPSGGGGGYSQAGESVGDTGAGGDGGNGFDASNYFGTSYGDNGWFAGGGGGGDGGAGGNGAGGIGGGGGAGSHAMDNTGGGGGGQQYSGGPDAGDGGDGIVIVQYLEPTLPQLFDGFEDGDVNEWDNTNLSGWGADSFESFKGSYSASQEYTDLSAYIMAQRSFGTGVHAVELFWRETSSSHGGGYQFLDSDGNRVAGVGTENPQWIYTDGSAGSQLYSGDGYGRWIRTLVEFNYNNGTVTYTFEDAVSGTTRTASSQNMDNNGIVTQMQVVNIGNSGDLGGQSVGSSNYYHWTDEIRIEPGTFTPSAPTNLSVTTVTDSEIGLSWTDNATTENGFNIYRALSSGSTTADYSQIDSVGENTTTYTDTTVAESETYYYRTTAFNDEGESDVSNEVTSTTDSSVSGTVTLNGSGVENATIYIIDDTNGELAATTTTDANGDYSVAVDGGITIHVTVRYDDGSTKYTDESKPFVVT